MNDLARSSAHVGTAFTGTDLSGKQPFNGCK